MAQLQEKYLTTPSGETVKFVIDPSLDTSEIEKIQQGIQQQWANPGVTKTPRLPVGSIPQGQEPAKLPVRQQAPAAQPAPAPSQPSGKAAGLESIYPALTDKIATARSAGYSEPEIQKHIQGRIQKAFKAGYSQEEVGKYLGEVGPGFGQRLAERFAQVPGELYETGKMLATPRPLSWKGVKEFAKGLVPGVTAGIYDPFKPPQTDEEKAYRTSGNLGGMMAPFAGATKVLRAAGMAARPAELIAGAGTGAVGPATRGEGVEAIVGGTTGAAMSLPFMMFSKKYGRPPKNQAEVTTALKSDADFAAQVEAALQGGQPQPAAPSGKPTLTQVAQQAKKPKVAPSEISGQSIQDKIARLEAENAAMRGGPAPSEGIPAFITGANKQRLAGMGYSAEDIAKMKPAEVMQILQGQPVAPKPADPIMAELKRILAKQAKNESLTPEEQGFMDGYNEVPSGGPKPSTLSRQQTPTPTQFQQQAARARAGAQAGPTLPPSLRGAKPRYNYGANEVNLSFNSDVEKAAFIVAQQTGSKANAAYLDWLQKNAGMNRQQAMEYGNQIKTFIKSQASQGARDVNINADLVRRMGGEVRGAQRGEGNLRAILKQQDIDAQKASAIQDAQMILADPNSSSSTLAAARAKLEELGIAPRTRPEVVREMENIKVLREGQKLQEREGPLGGVPESPMSPEERSMQARAFTPAKPTKPTLTEVAQKAKRPSRAKADENLSLQGFLKREGGLPTGELPGEMRAMGKQMPGLWRKKAPSINEQAEKAHAAGFIEEPTTGALLEALSERGGRRAVSGSGDAMEAQIKADSIQGMRMEIESAASAKVDQLAGTKDPLQFEGKEYQGAVAEKGGNLRLKDDPDKVLTQAEDILSVERTESGFPWESGGGDPQLTPAVKIGDQVLTGKSHAEIATQQAKALESGGNIESGFVDPDGKFLTEAQVKGTHFEKTEAGMQGVMPGMEGRSVPEGATKPGVGQQEGLTPLEQAAQDPLGVKQMKFGELVKKGFGSESGVIGRLTPEQQAAEQAARAARSELYGRIRERAALSGRSMLQSGEELGLSPALFNRLQTGVRIDQVVESLGSTAQFIHDMNERARMALPEAETIARTGTLERETRVPFREQTGPKPDTYKFRFSEEDIDAARTRVIDTRNRVTDLLQHIENAGDPLASDVARVARKMVDNAVHEANRAADYFRKLRFASGRAVRMWDEPPLPASIAGTLRDAGVLIDQTRNIKDKLPIYTNIQRSLKNWDNLPPAELAQLGRDLVDAFRLNLFSVSSFSLDLVSNLTEVGTQLTSGLTHDLAHVAKGHATFPALSGAIHAIRSRKIPLDVMEGISPTFGGEHARGGFGLVGDTAVQRIQNALKGKFGEGQGTFTMRGNLLSKAVDYLPGTPLYLKGAVDTASKRFAASMHMQKEAIMAADARGLKVGSKARAEFIDRFWDDPPDVTIQNVITEANKAGFARKLSPLENSIARSTIAKLIVDPFPSWPFQFTRWAGEMLGYNPKLFQKALRGQATAEEIGTWVGRTATGWGGLMLVDKMLYDKVDFNSMRYRHDDGNFTRLSGREPIPTALFFNAIARGNLDDATGALRHASIPGARAFLREGGLLGSFLKQTSLAAENAKIDPKGMEREITDAANRAIPGQALLSMIKTIFDPTVREGVGANLPGVSNMLPHAINLSTGGPLQPRQKLLGMEFPAIGGTPIPGAMSVMDPAAKLLSRYGLTVNRGAKSPIVGLPASEVPTNIRREWLEEFGRAQGEVMPNIAPWVAEMERNAPKGQLQPGSPRYELIRKRVQEAQTFAAKQATRTVNYRYGPKPKPQREPTVRERRAPVIDIGEPPSGVVE